MKKSKHDRPRITAKTFSDKSGYLEWTNLWKKTYMALAETIRKKKKLLVEAQRRSPTQGSWYMSDLNKDRSQAFEMLLDRSEAKTTAKQARESRLAA